MVLLAASMMREADIVYDAQLYSKYACVLQQLGTRYKLCGNLCEFVVQLFLVPLPQLAGSHQLPPGSQMRL